MTAHIRTTAKELKIPERKFVQFLLREKYLFTDLPPVSLLPYNKDSNAGLFIVRRFCDILLHRFSDLLHAEG